MKTISLGLILSVALIASASAQVYHQGYTDRNGVYHQPHWQSSPDRSYNNNWGVSPNVNPYTGQFGTHQPTWNDRPPSNPYGFGNQPNPYANPYRR